MITRVWLVISTDGDDVSSVHATEQEALASITPEYGGYGPNLNDFRVVELYYTEAQQIVLAFGWNLL